MSRRRARLALALATIVAATAPVALAAQGSPTPQYLMARHDSLVGGRSVLDQQESMRIVGVLTIPLAQIESPFEILKRKPDSYYFRSSLGPLGEMHQGFDGTTAWVIAPGEPPMILSGAMKEQVITQADFYADLHDTTRFASARTVGVVDFEGKRVHEVRMVRHDGTEVTEYFDVATGLSAGGITSADSPTGRMQQVSVHTDYKEFGGFRMATRIVQRTSSYEVILSISLVEFNTVDSAAVVAPESVRKLVSP